MACCKEFAGDEEVAGGFDFTPVNKDENLICSICFLIVNDAMGTLCSHIFCKKCIQKLIKQEDVSDVKFRCPDCQQEVTELTSNSFVNRLVRGLDIFCTRREIGCGWIGTIGSYLSIEDHVKIFCDFTKLECNFSAFGCKQQILRKDLEEHLKFSMREHLDLISKKIIDVELKSKLKEAEIAAHKQEVRDNEKVSQGKIDDLDRENKALKQESLRMKEKYAAKIISLEKENLETKELLQEQQKAIEELKKLVVKQVSTPSASTQTPSFLSIDDILVNGYKKFLMKINLRKFKTRYSDWYKQAFEQMKENKIYDYQTILFIKIQNINKMNWVLWSSNNKEEQIKVAGRRDTYHKEGGLVLRDDEGFLCIGTETLETFNHKNNTNVYLLHPHSQIKIACMERGYYYNSYHNWCYFDYVLDDYHLKGFLILTMCKN